MLDNKEQNSQDNKRIENRQSSNFDKTFISNKFTPKNKNN